MCDLKGLCKQQIQSQGDGDCPESRVAPTRMQNNVPGRSTNGRTFSLPGGLSEYLLESGHFLLRSSGSSECLICHQSRALTPLGLFGQFSKGPTPIPQQLYLALRGSDEIFTAPNESS